MATKRSIQFAALSSGFLAAHDYDKKPIVPAGISNALLCIFFPQDKHFYARKGTRLNVPEKPLLYVPSHTARDLDTDPKTVGIPKHTPFLFILV